MCAQEYEFLKYLNASEGNMCEMPTEGRPLRYRWVAVVDLEMICRMSPVPLQSKYLNKRHYLLPTQGRRHAKAILTSK
ncbi:transporter [Plakobranchus ocellatus]|uniref:Transporter n=1 Tax=Plakobranchus ocellatus TaxID=259542 RepID=A0AAV4DIS7_9GAST|nr:transporter [Plakobranchus ocellatus]